MIQPKRPDANFSKDLRELIADSRIVALELGYSYISTIHFLLADCRSERLGSIRNFSFKTRDDFDNFLKSQKIGDMISLENLPLTIEAELTIRKAIKLYKTRYIEKHIQPHHFFLAASLLPKTLFFKASHPNENLNKKLENYYFNTGILDPEKKRKGFWSRILAIKKSAA